MFGKGGRGTQDSVSLRRRDIPPTNRKIPYKKARAALFPAQTSKLRASSWSKEKRKADGKRQKGKEDCALFNEGWQARGTGWGGGASKIPKEPKKNPAI